MVYLLNRLPFGDVLVPDLDPWVTQGFQQVSRVQTHQISCFIGHWGKTTGKQILTYDKGAES